MKTVGFIGGFDKTDLILYVAKMLTETGKKVIFVDATMTQRARYIIPTIIPGKSYITEFENFDVAIGFHNLAEIEKYLETDNLEYDFALFDIDSRKAFEDFNIVVADKKYFVTAFDNYSLRKGLAIFGKLPINVSVTKVLFSKEMLKEEDVYLNFLSANYPIQWEKAKIYFPHEQGDCSVIIENQRAEKISFKEFTLSYKEGLLALVQSIYPEGKIADLKRTLKNI